MTVAAVYASWSAAQGHISAKTAATRRSAWGAASNPPGVTSPWIDVKTSAVADGSRRWSPTASGRRRSRTRSECCARCSVQRSRTAGFRATRATG